ncbi:MULTISPECIES: hypothetical protein [unclassified Microbacterium]|uniref:VG15 protein n=1 Tax=unclassified Microbacterium TaxID=2609290 RepID=UPI0003FBC99E|nr:hypothetical protein [Microbacterium sp. B24]
MTTPQEWDRLARAHMAKQVTDAGNVQAALSRLWDETVDPADLTRSFLRFREASVDLIMAGRSISKAEAQRYFEAVHNIAGLDSDLADVYSPEYGARQIKSSLTAASSKSLARAEALAAKGLPAAAALEIAKRTMLASAKRQMLNAGRDRVIGLTRTSGYGRWARVSDGSPCAFCMMLVSRGAVYTADTARFRAHDGCGCSARPVQAGEPKYSSQARDFLDLWKTNGGTVQELRLALDRRARAGGLDLAA